MEQARVRPMKELLEQKRLKEGNQITNEVRHGGSAEAPRRANDIGEEEQAVLKM